MDSGFFLFFFLFHSINKIPNNTHLFSPLSTVFFLSFLFCWTMSVLLFQRLFALFLFLYALAAATLGVYYFFIEEKWLNTGLFELYYWVFLSIFFSAVFVVCKVWKKDESNSMETNTQIKYQIYVYGSGI